MTDTPKTDCTVQSTVWDGRTVFVETWPTHFYANGLARPTGLCRYKIGDSVQMKLGPDGPVTVLQLQVTQYRWAPPEVIYHLSNGKCASDWQVW